MSDGPVLDYATPEGERELYVDPRLILKCVLNVLLGGGCFALMHSDSMAMCLFLPLVIPIFLFQFFIFTLPASKAILDYSTVSLPIRLLIVLLLGSGTILTGVSIVGWF